MTEEWWPTPLAPGYEASSEGRIRRARPAQGATVGRHLTQFPREGGRLFVNCRIAGKVSGRAVSRLVCAAFHGAPPFPKAEAAHWDGDFLNNVPGNLRWATNLENAEDSRRLGTIANGERHGQAKVTEADVARMFGLRQTGTYYRDIAKEFGICPMQAWRILNGQRWQHLWPTFGEENV